MTNIKNSISEFFTVVQTAISDFFSKDTTDTKTFGEQIKERFSVFISVGEWISSAWSKLSGFIKSVYNSVSALAGTLGTGGLLMLIGGIFIGVKVLKAVYNISNFAKNVTSAIGDISKSLKIDKKAKRLVEVRNVILSLALVIGTLVAAVYLIGKMDTDQLKKGGIVVGLLVGGLIVLATAATLIGSKAKYFKSIKNAGKGIFQFAAAIGILAASMIVLGHIKWKTFISGAAKLAIIAGLLGTFMIVMNKFGGRGFKSTGLLAVVGAIGILSLIARLIGGMDAEKMWRGIARVTAIAVILGTFAIVVNKLGGSSVNAIGLLGIAAAIGILGAIATMLAILPRDTLLKGILSIGGIALVLVGTAAALNLLTRSLNIGAALVTLAGFGLILVAFGYVLDKVRDIDPTVMITFAATLALSLVTVVGLFAVAGSLAGPVLAGAGVIGVIAGVGGLIIGILGAIDEHCGGAILSAMQRGGEIMQAFGEAVGSFIGGIGGGIIKALSESAGEALTTFGESIDAFTEKISGISASESLSSDIDTVIGIATAMAGLFDGLGGITLNLSGSSWFNSGTETLAADMEIFRTAISDFESSVSGMSEGTLVDDSKAALKAATSIRDFLDGISELDIETNKGAIAKWLTGDTKTGSLFSQMGTLGEAISSLNTNFGGLSQNGFAENVETVRTSMESITSLLNNFYVRSEEDIHALASEIAHLTYNEQRSLGAT